MGFKGIKRMTKIQQSTVEFADVARTIGIRRAAVDMQYLAYFVEEVMMRYENADTVADIVEYELARAQVAA